MRPRGKRRLGGLVALTIALGLLGLPPGGARAATPGVGNPALEARWFWGQRLRGAGAVDPAAVAALYEAARRSAQALETRPWQAAGAPGASAWVPIGPSPVTGEASSPDSGRVSALAVSPTGALYAGSAGGGVWLTTDGGASWAPLTDGEPSLAVGALALDPANPEVVYAGTGEDNGSADSFYGEGLLVSSDGGAAWTVAGANVFSGHHFSSIVVNPHDPNQIWVAGDFGLWTSSDGGSTWTQLPVVTSANVPVNVWSLVEDPADPSVLYASVDGVGIEMSSDGGQTWQLLSEGLPTGSDVGRAAIAVAPSDPLVVYAAITYSQADPKRYGDLMGLYVSSDAGQSWTQLPNTPDYVSPAYAYGDPSEAPQGWYDNVLAVSPTNPKVLFAGGIDLVASNDGGETWTNLTAQDAIHVDVHAFAFDGAGDLYVGTDGGVWEISPSGQVTDRNGNLDITQLYPGPAALATAPDFLAGSQDNGTLLYSGTPTWTSVTCGDGTTNAVDPLDASVVFAVCAPGQVEVSQDGGRSWSAVAPPYSNTPAWVTPIVLTPNPATPADPDVYVGGANVWETTDDGAGWQRLSNFPDASQGYVVSALAAAPSNPAVLYAGLSDGALYASTDGGGSWTSVSVPDAGRWITHITVAPNDPSEIWVTFSGFDFPQSEPSAPHVLTTTDALTASPSWTDLTGNLPNAPVNSLILLDGNPDEPVVATDVGVFAAGAPGVWQALGTGLPDVEVMDLMQTPTALVALTHGRGAWELPLAAAAGGERIALALAPSGPDLPAGTTLTVTAAVYGGAGAPQPGVDLAVTTTGTLPTSGLSSGTLVTGADGTASFTFRDTKAGDSGTIRVADSATAVAAETPTLTVVPGTPAALSVAPTTPVEVAPGSPATFTFTLADAYGNPIPGATLAFSVTGTLVAADLSAASAVTGADGTASVTYTDPHAGDQGTVVATLAGGTLTAASPPVAVGAAASGPTVTVTLNGTPVLLGLPPGLPELTPLTLTVPTLVQGRSVLVPLTFYLDAQGQVVIGVPTSLTAPLPPGVPSGPPVAAVASFDVGGVLVTSENLAPTDVQGSGVTVPIPTNLPPGTYSVVVVLVYPNGALYATSPVPWTEP